MLSSSIARRTFVVNKALLRPHLRLSSSLMSLPPPPNNNNNNNNKVTTTTTAKRDIHNTPRCEQADVSTTERTTNKVPSTILDRFTITAEVTVSKIFPAGFGWQTSSILACNYFGFATDSLNFAVTTGLGDAIGVFCGHVLYYGSKKTIYDGSINMKREGQIGFLLGTAAFFSGTAWQPIVNLLQGANLPFVQVFAGTWLGCGTAFYVGLRCARTVFSGSMEHIQEPTYENSKNDKSLSAAIGGATGFFVGTDAAYLPDQNFLIDYVGIKAGTPDLVGCAVAGTSTSMGFVAAQSTMNIMYPPGKLWND